MSQGEEEAGNEGMVVFFAVVGREPPSFSRVEQCPVCPTVGMYRVDENDVSLIYCNGYRALLTCRRHGGRGVKMIKSAQVVWERFGLRSFILRVAWRLRR